MPPARRSRFALRFSLRVLLIAFTAFAIGFPVWYRWPYEESQDESISMPADPFAPPGATRPPVIKRTLVTTWQRQWGGGRLKDGPERLYEDGKLVIERTFINGQRHGPHHAGALSGQYVEGKKEGMWEVRDQQGKVVSSSMWHAGRLDGLHEFTQHEGTELARRRKLLFAQGQLISVDGQAVDDRLAKLAVTGKIEMPEVANVLLSETDVEFVETPLKDFADFLVQKHQVPMVVDRHHADLKRPITGQWQGIHLSSALAILMSEHDHGCDYRYGMIWITSAKDANDWRDPTGVSEIEPPRNSQLARTWYERADIDAIDKPLAEALEELSHNLAIDIDTSAIETADNDTDEHKVRLRLRGYPMRHGLGILLYQARCRVKLEGETLVILPPK